MVYKIADNITSPLGMTTAENYSAVKDGHSVLRHFVGKWGIPEPFCASLFSDVQNDAMLIDGMTRFESMVVCSIRHALKDITFNIAGPDVVFLLATTKANVEQLGCDMTTPSVVYPGESALHISQAIGITTTPIVVSNACISGLSAIIAGCRLLESGQYAHAIVCGADVLNRFVISGFQSLKALSEDTCKPFDMERLGLNLGEAAATIVLSVEPGNESRPWSILSGAIHNDAYHISAPSKRGDGAYLCLKEVLQGIDMNDVAFVNAHGTATLFNDQMESVAIERAGLGDIPVNALKGYYGHTLGAAGIVETLLCMRSLDDHTVLGTKGYEELGVSGKIRISSTHGTTDKNCFVKMISGFGGCNATLVAGLVTSEVLRLRSKDKEPMPLLLKEREKKNILYETKDEICIMPEGVTLNDQALTCHGHGKELLTNLYKEYVGDYPKYYKMDGLSKLGFIASELLLHSGRGNKTETSDDAEFTFGRCAIILFNHSSSLCADKHYLESIEDKDNYFPSPSLFVYTLPNIVTGEIAIKNGLHGETAFYILPERNETTMRQVVDATFLDPSIDSMITGWIDYEDDQHFEADMRMIRVKREKPR